jgi:hypothetical protein
MRATPCSKLLCERVAGLSMQIKVQVTELILKITVNMIVVISAFEYG